MHEPGAGRGSIHGTTLTSHCGAHLQPQNSKSESKRIRNSSPVGGGVWRAHEKVFKSNKKGWAGWYMHLTLAFRKLRLKQEKEGRGREGRGREREEIERRERKRKKIKMGVAVHTCNPAPRGRGGRIARRRSAGRWLPQGVLCQPEARPYLKNKHTKTSSILSRGLHIVGVWRMREFGVQEASLYLRRCLPAPPQGGNHPSNTNKDGFCLEHDSSGLSIQGSEDFPKASG